MALLKNLFGDGSKDRELAEDMRAVLKEMREEREKFANLLETSHSATDTLHELGDPIAKASQDVEEVLERMREVEPQLTTLANLTGQIAALSARAEGLATDQERTTETMKTVIQDSTTIRTVFEELREKVDLAVNLRERLETFLEVEKPFSLIHGEADALRSQVESTSEHLGRIREQHERLMDSHKLAMQ